MVSLSQIDAIDDPHNDIKSKSFGILTVLLRSATANNTVKFVEKFYKYITYYILTLQDLAK